MLRPLRSITYAVVMVHTNCLDKRESERSFRNTGIGGYVVRRRFFAAFFSRGCDLHTLLAILLVHVLLPSFRIIRNALRNQAYLFHVRML